MPSRRRRLALSGPPGLPCVSAPPALAARPEPPSRSSCPCRPGPGVLSGAWTCCCSRRRRSASSPPAPGAGPRPCPSGRRNCLPLRGRRGNARCWQCCLTMSRMPWLAVLRWLFEPRIPGPASVLLVHGSVLMNSGLKLPLGWLYRHPRYPSCCTSSRPPRGRLSGRRPMTFRPHGEL